MPEFPRQPVSPREFFETWLPAAFAEAGAPPGAEDVQVKLGVRLEGGDGGEWVFDLDHGKLGVAAGPRDETAFTVVQSVDDWRGALWGGKGGAFGQQARQMFDPGAQAAAASAGAAPGAMAAAAPGPAALAQLASLQGLLRMVVKAAPEDAGGEDWTLAFKLGPGPIPAEPTTTITVSADDADAMARGELDPMQAFMAGRIQVAGDMTLMMQMQAIQMQAAAAQAQKAPGGSGGSG